MEKTKKEILRSIPDGGMLTIPLKGENPRAWYSRVWEENQADGWNHYAVSVNNRVGTITLMANEHGEDEA